MTQFLTGVFYFYIKMKDNFSVQSAQYARFRPSYPPVLYEYIFSHVPEKHTAWDCATGNGQAAIALASRFEQVFATDMSQRQIDNATRAANIFYSVQPAEQTSFPGDSFDLITVAQALHWFRFESFYNEVRRVAKPSAVLACWSYSLVHISPGIDEITHDFHYNAMSSYWDEERKWVDEGYQTIPFVFEKMSTPEFYIEVEWTTEQLAGYLGTWSSVQKFISMHQYNPVDEILTRIKPLWKSDRMKARFPLHLLMAQIRK